MEKLKQSADFASDSFATVKEKLMTFLSEWQLVNVAWGAVVPTTIILVALFIFIRLFRSISRDIHLFRYISGDVAGIGFAFTTVFMVLLNVYIVLFSLWAFRISYDQYTDGSLFGMLNSDNLGVFGMLGALLVAHLCVASMLSLLALVYKKTRLLYCLVSYLSFLAFFAYLNLTTPNMWTRDVIRLDDSPIASMSQFAFVMFVLYFLIQKEWMLFTVRPGERQGEVHEKQKELPEYQTEFNPLLNLEKIREELERRLKGLYATEDIEKELEKAEKEIKDGQHDPLLKEQLTLFVKDLKSLKANKQLEKL